MENESKTLLRSK